MTMLSFIVLVIVLCPHLCHTKSTLSCGAVVQDWIYKNETHHFQFITNGSYDVTINTCFSDIDIELGVRDHSNNMISEKYCPSGDLCGNCTNYDNYAENFTIPQMHGTYSIALQPWDATVNGAYQLQINCSNISSPIPMTTASPNNTLTYTTRSPFHCSGSCLDACPFCDGQIYCASELLGTLDTSHAYYYFNASTVHSVLFDTCDGETWSNLTLYDTDLRVVASGTPASCLAFAQQLAIVTYKSEYILGIGGVPGFYVVSTACQDTSAEDIFHEQQAECGHTLHNEWNVSFNHYYHFNLPANGSVYIDSCQSSSDIFLYLYDWNLTLLYESQDYGNCWYIWIPHLVHGMYYLRVHGFSAHYSQVGIHCGDVQQTAAYKLLSDLMAIIPDYESNWFDAEVLCEELYGTTLATIVTNDDIDHLVNWTTSLRMGAFSAWVGMYRDVANESQWQWVNGISCNYTNTNDCADDVKWATDEPTDFLDHEKKQFGAYLMWMNNTTTSMYATPFPVLPYFESGEVLGICDAPTSKYKPRNCSKIEKCWKKIAFYDDSYLLTDTSDHEPPIAFWNSTLFVIGSNEIHYTKISTFHANELNYQWFHVTYNHNSSLETLGITDMASQRFCQHESSLFLYVQTTLFQEEQNILMQINLSNLEIKQHVIPVKNLLSSLTYMNEYDFWGLLSDGPSNGRPNYCMVSGPNYTYIIGSLLILMYDRNEDRWSTLEFVDTVPAACAITNDYQYIYIFGHYDSSIIKYDTDLFKYDALATANLCLYSVAKAVIALNDKIYLHGCHTASWKTLVFDTTTEQFESETIDFGAPIAYNIPYYRSSQMTVFTDNVLLLLHPKNTEYPLFHHDPADEEYVALYYAVTELISINFAAATKAILNESIWP
eukprot:206362_1